MKAAITGIASKLMENDAKLIVPHGDRLLLAAKIVGSASLVAFCIAASTLFMTGPALTFLLVCYMAVGISLALGAIGCLLKMGGYCYNESNMHANEKNYIAAQSHSKYLVSGRC